MLTWLVTGATGFVGSAVLRTLAAETPRASTILALGRHRPHFWPSDQFLTVDLTDCEPLTLTRQLAPYGTLAVVHAAGRTPPADSRALFAANTRATACLLEALEAHPFRSRIVLVGSAAELGPVPPEQVPTAEETRCRPADSYGLSKWAATRLGLAGSRPGRTEVMVGRLFNPIGPGLPASQVFGRLATRLATATEGLIELTVGSLAASRDFFDIRDAAEALLALVREGRPGRIYHIGSGHEHTVGEGLGQLIRASGRSVMLRETGWPPRPGPSSSCAAIERIVAETSWRPRVSFEQSLNDLWNDVLGRASAADQPRSVA